MALYSIEYFRCIVYTVRAVREPIKSHVIGGLFCVYFDLGALRNVLQKQYFIIYLFIAQDYLDSENQWILARRYNCILSLLQPHKRLCSYKDLDYNNPLKRGNSDFNSAVKSVSINSDSLSYTLL